MYRGGSTSIGMFLCFHYDIINTSVCVFFPLIVLLKMSETSHPPLPGVKWMYTSLLTRFQLVNTNPNSSFKPTLLTSRPSQEVTEL